MNISAIEGPNIIGDEILYNIDRKYTFDIIVTSNKVLTYKITQETFLHFIQDKLLKSVH